MKQKLLYFTNKDQLIESLDLISAPDFSDFYSYRFGNAEVVLIYDQLSLSEFKEKVWLALGELRECITYYIYHTYPGKEIRNMLDEHPSVHGAAEDIHEIVGDHTSQYYIQLEELFDSGELDSNIFATLWEQFDKDSKLEQILDDLHAKRIAAFGDQDKTNELRAYRDNRIAKL